MWNLSGKKYGVAVYNFDGSRVAQGLNLDVGDTVYILEELGEWVRGYAAANKQMKGIFPRSYVHIKELPDDVKGYDVHDDQLIQELTTSIRSWARIWKAELFVKDNMMCKAVRLIMLEAVEGRKELMTSALSSSQRKEVRQRMSAKIDWMNKRLNLDVVPRLNNEPVDPDAIGPVMLYNLHAPRKQIPTTVAGRGQLYVYQLHMRLHHLQCQGIGESDKTEVYFSLYNVRESKHICERILCRIDKDGKWADGGEHNKAKFCCLMADMTIDDNHADIYIVAHVYRVGSLLLKDGAKKAKQIAYKRPVGCAVLGISEVLQGSLDLKEECTHLIKIVQCNESDYPTLADSIIRKQAVKETKHSTAGASSSIVISLRLLNGDLTSARRNNPLLFNKSLVYAQPLTIQNLAAVPDITRNDLYITINKGDFDKGTKKSGLNIEVKMVLIHKTAGIIEDAISAAAGDTPSPDFRSVVFYHNSQPRWNETIRLAISTDMLTDVHVRFEFRHCSVDAGEKKLLGFSFMKVADAKGAPVKNGTHQLIVYRVAENHRLGDANCPYVDLPYLDTGGDIGLTDMLAGTHGAAFVRSMRESFHADTLLCSMRLTQCVKLLNFFKWRDHKDILQDVLVQFKKAEANEMLKFCTDIFNILFEMFPVAEQNEHLVFSTLVHVLHIVNDERYSHSRSLFTTYIQEAFSAPLTFRYLLGGLRQLMDSQSWERCYDIFTASKNSTKAAENRVLSLLFKIIVQAALLYRRSSGDERNQEFQDDINSFWRSACILLSAVSTSCNPKDGAALARTQAALLGGLPSTVDDLMCLLPPKQLADKIVAAVTSACHDDDGHLSLPRLHCVRSVVALKLFDNDDARHALMGVCVAQLKACLLRSRHIEFASETLGELLSSLHGHRLSPFYGDDVLMLVTSLLDVTIATVLDNVEPVGSNHATIEEKDEAAHAGSQSSHTVGCLVACLVGLLDSMTEEQYGMLLLKLPSRDVQKSFTMRILRVLLELITQKLIRDDWMVMLMITNRAILKTVRYVCGSLRRSFLKGDDFDKLLWQHFFRLGVCFITQLCLQLETFSDNKAEGLLEKYSDMRLLMCDILLLVWEELGDRRIFFVPMFVGPFLEVSLIPQPRLRQMVLPMFFDMMVCEQKACGNFGKVAAELIDRLDEHINQDKGDSDYLERFRSILLQKMHTDQTLREEGGAFIGSVTDLLERLLDYRRVLKATESKEAHMFGTLSVLNFYEKVIHRQQLYNSYVYKLVDLHIEAHNFAEAACTLMLCASKLNWTANSLPADVKFPAQKEWERKNILYEQAIRYFEMGQSFEYGIQLCKELAEFYEHKLYDYTKLGSVLTAEAKFFNNILNKEPGGSYFFRVGFIGRPFPAFLRNKVFIYRGDAFSQLGIVMKKINMEFPNAKILNPNTVPSDEMRMGDIEYIQLSAAQPLHDGQPPCINALAGVDERLAEYMRHCSVNHFQYDRAYHKDNKKDEKNEFKSLSLSRMTFAVASPLPWVLRWAEVTSITTEELSPIEAAIDAVQKKNKELQKTIQDFTTEKTANVQPLSRQLGGVIDAAVNGGTAKYQEAFFTAEYVQQYPSHEKFIRELKALFTEQVKVLGKGLALHGSRITEDMRPFHDNLEETFKKMLHSMRLTTGNDVSEEINKEVGQPSGNTHSSAPMSTGSVVKGTRNKHCWLKELDYETMPIHIPWTSILDTASDGANSRGSSGYSSSDIECKPPELPRKDYDMLPSNRISKNKDTQPPLPRKVSEGNMFADGAFASTQVGDRHTARPQLESTTTSSSRKGSGSSLSEEMPSSPTPPPKRAVSRLLLGTNEGVTNSPSAHHDRDSGRPSSRSGGGTRSQSIAHSPLTDGGGLHTPALPPKSRKGSLPVSTIREHEDFERQHLTLPHVSGHHIHGANFASHFVAFSQTAGATPGCHSNRGDASRVPASAEAGHVPAAAVPSGCNPNEEQVPLLSPAAPSHQKGRIPPPTPAKPRALPRVPITPASQPNNHSDAHPPAS